MLTSTITSLLLSASIVPDAPRRWEKSLNAFRYHYEVSPDHIREASNTTVSFTNGGYLRYDRGFGTNA